MTTLEKFHNFAKDYYEIVHCVGPKQKGKIKRFPDQERMKEAWIEQYPNEEFYCLWNKYIEDKCYKDYVSDFHRK